MSNVRTMHLRLLVVAALGLGLLAALFAVRATAAPNASHASRLVVKSVQNRTLNEMILVNLRGRTLYSLSAETHGRFICKDMTCLSAWTPLVVPRGTTPTGAKLLATIRRPDGRTQVTYRGKPLYTFNGDRKSGDAKGNGFKDVGTWLAASLSPAKTAPPPPPPSYGSGGSYGGYGGYGG